MITMNKEEIKEYLRRVDELELKLTGEDKETLQWLLFGYNECARLLEESEKENFDLREGIMLEKMAIPEDKVDIRNFYKIFEVPSYNQLEQALLDIKEYVEYYTKEYPECKVAEFDIMANPHCILDIINNVIKKDK